jgi:hypothetical protein
MTVEQLIEVRDAAASSSRSGRHVFDDFIIFHLPSMPAILGETARALRARLRERIPGLRA